MKGRRILTEEIEAESQAVLNTLRENDLQNALKTPIAPVIVVKPQKGATLKMIPAPNN